MFVYSWNYSFTYLFACLLIYSFTDLFIYWLFNPSSPKGGLGGCTNPPNGFRPGAQNCTAEG